MMTKLLGLVASVFFATNALAAEVVFMTGFETGCYTGSTTCAVPFKSTNRTYVFDSVTGDPTLSSASARTAWCQYDSGANQGRFCSSNADCRTGSNNSSICITPGTADNDWHLWFDESDEKVVVGSSYFSATGEISAHVLFSPDLMSADGSYRLMTFKDGSSNDQCYTDIVWLGNGKVKLNTFFGSSKYVCTGGTNDDPCTPCEVAADCTQAGSECVNYKYAGVPTGWGACTDDGDTVVETNECHAQTNGEQWCKPSPYGVSVTLNMPAWFEATMSQKDNGDGTVTCSLQSSGAGKQFKVRPSTEIANVASVEFGPALNLRLDDLAVATGTNADAAIVSFGIFESVPNGTVAEADLAGSPSSPYNGSCTDSPTCTDDQTSGTSSHDGDTSYVLTQGQNTSPEVWVDTASISYPSPATGWSANEAGIVTAISGTVVARDQNTGGSSPHNKLQIHLCSNNTDCAGWEATGPEFDVVDDINESYQMVALETTSGTGLDELSEQATASVDVLGDNTGSGAGGSADRTRISDILMEVGLKLEVVVKEAVATDQNTDGPVHFRLVGDSITDNDEVHQGIQIALLDIPEISVATVGGATSGDVTRWWTDATYGILNGAPSNSNDLLDSDHMSQLYLRNDSGVSSIPDFVMVVIGQNDLGLYGLSPRYYCSSGTKKGINCSPDPICSGSVCINHVGTPSCSTNADCPDADCDDGTCDYYASGYCYGGTDHGGPCQCSPTNRERLSDHTFTCINGKDGDAMFGDTMSQEWLNSCSDCTDNSDCASRVACTDNSDCMFCATAPDGLCSGGQCINQPWGSRDACTTNAACDTTWDKYKACQTNTDCELGGVCDNTNGGTGNALRYAYCDDIGGGGDGTCHNNCLTSTGDCAPVGSWNTAPGPIPVWISGSAGCMSPVPGCSDGFCLAANSVADLRDSVENLIETALQRTGGQKTIPIIGLEHDGAAYWWAPGTVYGAYRAAMLKYLRDNRYNYIDFQEAFSASGYSSTELMTDRIHPSSLGYSLYVDQIDKCLHEQPAKSNGYCDTTPDPDVCTQGIRGIPCTSNVDCEYRYCDVGGTHAEWPTQTTTTTSTSTTTLPPGVPPISGTGNASFGAGSVSPSVPNPTVSGDLLIAVCETDASGTFVWGSSYTELFNCAGGTGSSGSRLGVAYKTAGASEGSASFGNAGNHQICRIMGVDSGSWTGTPTYVTSTHVGTTSLVATGLNTGANNCLVLLAASDSADTNSNDNFANWVNGNLVDDWGSQINDCTNRNNGGCIGLYAMSKAVQGATGDSTTTFTFSNGTEGNGCQATISICP